VRSVTGTKPLQVHNDAGIDAANPAWRESAHDFERIVSERLRSFLIDGAAVHAAIRDSVTDTREMESALSAAADAGLELSKPISHNRPAMLSRFIDRVTLANDRVEVKVRKASLFPEASSGDGENTNDADPIILAAPTARVRRGHEVRLIIPSMATEKPVERDSQLVDLIVESHVARELLMASPGTSIQQLAKTQGRCRTHISNLIKVSYLAPEIVTMVLEGRQPPTLTRRALMAVELPLRWADQRILLGCD